MVRDTFRDVWRLISMISDGQQIVYRARNRYGIFAVRRVRFEVLWKQTDTPTVSFNPVETNTNAIV